MGDAKKPGPGVARPGQPRTGSVEPFERADGTTVYFRARIWLGDKSRVRVDVPAKHAVAAGGKTARERAEIYAEARQEREDETGELLAQKRARAPRTTRATPRTAPRGVESVAQWFGRYYDAAAAGHVGRKNRGRPQAAVEGRRSRFWTWIDPKLGHLPMAAVKAEDLRELVKRLDDQVRIRAAFYRGEASRNDKTGRKPGLSAKSAASVWGEVTSGFREACASKDDSLRVRGGPDDDPTRGVLPPESAEDREQAALFPSEVRQLLACPEVPLERRRCYAVAIYTGMRRGELARLRASDVDTDHDQIRVRGTKTAAAKRTIPIDPALGPLLEALLEEHEARAELARAVGADVTDAPLLAVARGDGKGGAADLTRADLARAEITRAELTRDDDTHMPFTFHGLRHTCITHWAVGGKGELFLLTAGGHTDVTMTKRYVAAASSVSSKFGTPHPPLPPSLMEAKSQAKLPGRQKQTGPIHTGSSLNSHGRSPHGAVTPMGIEPMFPT